MMRDRLQMALNASINTKQTPKPASPVNKMQLATPVKKGKA